MDIKKVLKVLCESCGVSGEENETAKIAYSLLKEYSNDIIIDDFNNVIVNIYDAGESAPKVLLDAHIDEIGMIVTYITDDGFLKVSNCGGIDKRLLLAQEVTIHGKEKIKGVIGAKPPHLTSEEDRKKVPDIESVVIDTGYTKKELEEIVSLGDRVTFCGDFAELKNDRVTAKSLDDRACITAILYALKLLKGKDLKCSLSVLLSSQEEVGSAGATVASYKINPDYAIVVDVSFAYTADAEERKCGKMGKGPMIGISPILDRKMSDEMIAISKAKGYDYQIEVMEGKTGTNADEITVTKNGVRAVTVSLPLKYMHTPVEMVEISDIKAVARLIADYISEHNWQ